MLPVLRKQRSDAIEIAALARVKTLALFHHAPERSDDELDEILRSARAAGSSAGLEVIAAYEHMELQLGET